MTDPHPDRPERGTVNNLVRGRNLGPLLGPWIACTIIAAGIFIVETKMPVFHDVVQILYFMLLVVLVIATGRWLRGRRGQRRQAERRQDQNNR